MANAKKRVFLSYCHDNTEKAKRLRDDIVAAGFEVWWDQMILPGQDWKLEIRRAMRTSYAVVLCLSEETGKRTTSGIYPEALDAIAAYRQHAPGSIFLIPARLSECEVPDIEIDDTRMLDRLQHIDLFPESQRTEGLQRLMQAIAAAAKQHEVTPEIPKAKPTPSKAQVIAPPSRLPNTGEFLIGREDELATLDEAWGSPKQNIVSIVAPGGVGKTQLVKKWRSALADDGCRGAERVYDWSFYSQGTSDKTASADVFIDETLRHFGEADPTAIKGAWEKGARLAELVRQHRTLLVLDGLEPLQHPPGPMAGRLTDQALEALLKGLAESNPGLCIITTREPVVELKGLSDTAHRTIDLRRLKAKDGAALLRKYGVKGKAADLRKASEQYEGHALALILLGTYLSEFGGDIARLDRVEDHVTLQEGDDPLSRHAKKVMASYVKWFEKDGDADAASRAAVVILRLMGLFNRPADSGCINALREEPIDGLTEPLFVGPDPDKLWQKAVKRLRRARLLAEAEPARMPALPSSDGPSGQPRTVGIPRTAGIPAGSSERYTALDAHPLVREYFAAQLKEHFPDAAREAHRRLYERLKQAAPEFPDTLQDMMPLYHAVAHGCAAGLYEAALYDVYHARIDRGDEDFGTRRLGAYGAALGAAACFFQQPWELVHSDLSHPAEASILGDAGFLLWALGRLGQAIQPMRTALTMAMELHDWGHAAKFANNLSEVQLMLGRVAAALQCSRASVEYADRNGHPFLSLCMRVTLADALHQAGRCAEAWAALREAEAIQQKSQPAYPLLYSVQGFKYCDLLLDVTAGLVSPGARISVPSLKAIRRRVKTTLTWITDFGRASLLSRALDPLTLGRTYLLEAERAMAESGSGPGANAVVMNRAEKNMDESVALLRRAGTTHCLPCGLLARAALRRVQGQFDGADEDLKEAESIAERGSMLIHQIDAAIERCRWYLAQGKRDDARKSLDRAKALVKETEAPYEPHVPTWDGWKPLVYEGVRYSGVFEKGEIVGYRRRDGEIGELAKGLGSRD